MRVLVLALAACSVQKPHPPSHSRVEYAHHHSEALGVDKRLDGAPLDKTIEDSWRRVAESLAQAEPESHRSALADRFAEAHAR